MSTKKNGNETHASVYTALVLVIIFALLYFVVNPPSFFTKNNDGITSEEKSVPARKAELLTNVRQTNGKPLSGELRAEILSDLNPENIQAYHFSDKEKAEIVKALNQR